jgi:hypothetical protein
VLPGRSHYAAYLEQFEVIWREARAWLDEHLATPSPTTQSE